MEKLQLQLENTSIKIKILYIQDIILIHNISIIENKLNNILFLAIENALEKVNYNNDIDNKTKFVNDSSLFCELNSKEKLLDYKNDTDNKPKIEKRKFNEVNEVIFIFLNFFLTLFKFILFVTFLYYPYKVKNFIKLNYRNFLFTIYFY